LLGHSDADVLLHAICDALLGAAALGDIGKHFPDSDKRFKGVSSIRLLRSVRTLLRQRHFKILNVDSTVVLEQPKISSHVPKMRKNICSVLGIGRDQVSVKATTNERLGPLGSEEGCAAFAVALIVEEKN
jgi:2-C-methyl-D-erythritol 2,4-cyclodiphosphate synthase